MNYALPLMTAYCVEEMTEESYPLYVLEEENCNIIAFHKGYAGYYSGYEYMGEVTREEAIELIESANK